MADKLTHFDSDGNAIMVDIGEKPETVREATAKGRIRLSKEAYEMVKAGTMKKGDVLGVARIAGIMAVKRTADLIPLCHPIQTTHSKLDFLYHDDTTEIEAVCTVRTTGQTGVEMEALTGVNISLLTIYDMCKAVDKSMVLHAIALWEKSGGKSGDYRREETR